MEQLPKHRTYGGETISEGCLPDYRSAWSLPEELIKLFDEGQLEKLREELPKIEPIPTYDGYVDEHYGVNAKKHIAQKRRNIEERLAQMSPTQRESGKLLLSQIQEPLDPSIIFNNTDPEKRRALNELAYDFNANLLTIKQSENMRANIDWMRYFVNKIKQLLPKTHQSSTHLKGQ